MKIQKLHLKDFEVIRDIELDNLSNFVVIAGPNGVGKTKIKDAICFIFQNNGNPPSGSSVVLEATNQEESSNWGSDAIELPNNSFWSFFSKRRRKIKTQARLIQIDSGRQIESIQFQQINFSQIGNPEDEEVENNYSYQKIRERFTDVCNTLHREKLKLLTDLGKDAHQKFSANPSIEEASVTRLQDPTQPFEEIFGKLLYPKKMASIEIHSSTLQYYDEDGNLRSFDQLSSGEREAVVVTFDILLQQPSDCIILIDEPEIHLHPELTFRLIKVLKSIGERNQFFLFTHSTDIISNSFETGIHFIRPKSKVVSGNQAVRVDLSNINDLMLIPNLREAIGMLSLGKKLLFIEGINTSIDKNVFATLAKSSKLDLALVSSEGCDNINNLALICDTLQKGVFGIDLFMVRDRDSITDEEVEIYTKKSGGKLIFLPFCHIENAFLVPEALFSLSKKMNVNNSKTLEEINQKLTELAKNQINRCVSTYVASEIRFKAGNFDTSPEIDLNNKTSVEDIIQAINNKKDNKLKQYENNFSSTFISERANYWNKKLTDSLSKGWSDDSRKYFHGKSILNQLQQWMFSNKSIILWEQMVNDDNETCLTALKPLRDILEKI